MKQFCATLIFFCAVGALFYETAEAQCPSVSANCPVDCNSQDAGSWCEDSCASNEGCPPGELCCLNPCGKFHCYASTSKPGTCPSRSNVGNSCLSTCNGDSDCHNNGKCCPTTCTRSGKDVRICSIPYDIVQNQITDQEERPGQCPNTDGMNACNMFSDCEYDGQCTQGFKCCRVTGACTVERCMAPVEIQQLSCPLKSNVVGMPYHECNDRSTCKSDFICCSNSQDKGRCVEPLPQALATSLRTLVKEGVCNDPESSFCGANTPCGGDNEDERCPSSHKCCKDAIGSYCCQPVSSNRPMNIIGQAKSNALVARTYLLPFNYACANIVDRKIQLQTGQPITHFQFMMLPMQDLMNNENKAFYPTLRLQLWSLNPTFTGQETPRYTLVCEKHVTTPQSLPKQVLYEFDVSDTPCFRNVLENDKAGFTFEVYGDVQTVIPVPYDYENAADPNSGVTDYRLFGCENHVTVGQEVPFTTNSNGFPGRWSFGVRQSFNTIP